jgi:hypothetical protein
LFFENRRQARKGKTSPGTTRRLCHRRCRCRQNVVVARCTSTSTTLLRFLCRLGHRILPESLSCFSDVLLHFFVKSLVEINYSRCLRFQGLLGLRIVVFASKGRVDFTVVVFTSKSCLDFTSLSSLPRVAWTSHRHRSCQGHCDKGTATDLHPPAWSRKPCRLVPHGS